MVRREPDAAGSTLEWVYLERVAIHMESDETSEWDKALTGNGDADNKITTALDLISSRG